MIADSQERLQELVRISVPESESKGLKVNVSMTHVMMVSIGDAQVPADIVINDQRLKQVQNFKYLGSTISGDGRRDCDINVFNNQQQCQTSNEK